MLPHRGYARDRIARAVERARARVHADRAAIEGLELAGPVGRIGYAEAAGLPYRPAVAGEPLGPLFATYWLRGTAVVPEGGPAVAPTCCSTRAGRRRCGWTARRSKG